jgi:hypothetical protein
VNALLMRIIAFAEIKVAEFTTPAECGYEWETN